MQTESNSPKLLKLDNVPLSIKEAKERLLAASDISNIPAVKPEGGEAYFFQGTSKRTKNDFSCDQYRFYSDGKYEHDGVLKRYYKIRIPGPGKKCLSSLFERHVYSIISKKADSDLPEVCLVHYVGDCSIHVDSKHKNAKSKTGLYLPTLKNVIDEVAEVSVLKKPKALYDDFQEKKSNETDQERMAVDRPRDVKQCENIKASLKRKRKLTNDEFYSTLEVAIQLENFVRKVEVFPDVVIHLADEKIVEITKQLLQLSTKKPELPQLLSYDTTFMLGNFYVSVLVARNTMLEGNPIYPVAFLIHTKKFSSYHRDFFLNIFPSIGLLKARHVPIVTDREKGITESLKKCVPEIKNLFCTNHVLRDIEFWLKKNPKAGKFDAKVLKDDVRQLIASSSKSDFDEQYIMFSSSWSQPFLEYVEKNVYEDLIHHCCNFVSSEFAAFQDGTIVTNNICESMNHVIKSITKHEQLPIDAIIMVFKQVQDVYVYDFMRGLTGFGNFQLKAEFGAYKKMRNELTLPKITSMNQIVPEILGKSNFVSAAVEKAPNFRLSQKAIARRCIAENLIGFTATTSSFTVLNPFGSDVQSVRYFPKPSKCSCPSVGLCFHIIAVAMSLGEPESNIRCQEQYSLSMLLRKKSGKERKPGRKRPRANDYDYEVQPAPDAKNPSGRQPLKVKLKPFPKHLVDLAKKDQSAEADMNSTTKPASQSTPRKKTFPNVSQSNAVQQDLNLSLQNSTLDTSLLDNVSFQHEADPTAFAFYPWEIDDADHVIALSNSVDHRKKKLVEECLEGSNWLTDEAIELALKCIISFSCKEPGDEKFLLWESYLISCAAKHVHDTIACFACKNEAMNNDHLLFLINPGGHWYVIFANLQEKKVIAIDSLMSLPSSQQELNRQFNNVYNILTVTFAVAGIQTSVSDWSFLRCMDVPQQTNTYDCGVHVITNCFAVMNKLPLPSSLDSSKTREWIKNMIGSTDLSTVNEYATKPKTDIIKAKDAARQVWSKNMIELDIIECSYDECYSIQQNLSSSKRWSTCDITDCPGNKYDDQQILCTSCRKWLHKSCLPGKIHLSNAYFSCAKAKFQSDEQ